MSVADTTSTALARRADGRVAARPAPRPRVEGLDGLRGLAALGVLVLHVWMFNYGDAGRPPKGALDLAIGELRLGVQLFFVLSGFLLYRPFVAAALEAAERPRLGRYAVRRAARILPAYVATVASAFVVMRWLDHPLQVGAGRLPIFLLFAQNQVGETVRHLDPPMWSLGVEVSFYAVLPLIALLAGRLGPHRGRQLAVPALVIAGGAVCTALAATHAWPVTVSTSLLLYLVEFGAGMALATLLHGRRLPRGRARWLAAAGALLVLANSWWHARGLGSVQVRRLVGDAPGILGLTLVLAAIAGSSWRCTLLARGPVRWLGTVSFGVYLIHFPVILALRRTGHWPDALAPEVVAVAAISIALATASWLLLERPAIRWTERATRRRPPRPRPAASTRPVARPVTLRPAGAPRALRPRPAER